RHTAKLVRRRGSAADHRLEPSADRGLGKRSAIPERLVQRDTKRELIGPRIDGAAEELLGWHVGRRALELAGLADRKLGQRTVVGGLEQKLDVGERPGLTRIETREAEVRDQQATVVAAQHVVGL